MPLPLLPDTLDRNNRHLIQHGFDLKGRFVSNQKKHSQGLVTIVQEDANMEFVYTTEIDGSFLLPNVLLYDTAKLSIVARSVKKKPGKIVLDSIVVTPHPYAAKPLQIEVIKTDKPDTSLYS